jgi:protein TonB
MLAVLPPAGTAGGGSGGREGAEIRLLRERIESRIVYPEEAVRRGQEGEVLLRIRVVEEGIPKEIRVTRSSGARALDEAARSGVVRAAPLPSTPGWFEVPVRFHLR